MTRKRIYPYRSKFVIRKEREKFFAEIEQKRIDKYIQSIGGRANVIEKGNLSELTGILEGTRDRIRELVRIRDNHTCQMCGRRWIVGNRRFDVHHEDESMEGKSHKRGITRYDRDNTDKMVTLCHKCHFSLDSVRRKISLAGRKSSEKAVSNFSPNPSELGNIGTF